MIAPGWSSSARSRRSKVPPAPYTETITGVESTIDSEYTDLSSAIKLALATFPDDTARRIVVVSDGNENRGEAYEQALSAAGLDVQIDVLPVDYNYDREVLVEKIALPPDVKKGETVNINVVVRAATPARGRLEIYQKADNSTVPIDTLEDVELQRGINVFRLKQDITDPNFYTYSAQFVPEEELRRGLRADRAMNNMAEGFTQYRGEANVLLIEGTANEHEELVAALRSKELSVTTLAAGDVTGAGLVGGIRCRRTSPNFRSTTRSSSPTSPRMPSPTLSRISSPPPPMTRGSA